METKKITQEMKAKLDAPLPPEAIEPHPTKNYLSTIKAIYVTERLNDVFGVGSWRVRSEFISEKTSTVSTKNRQKTNTMVVTKTIFEIPDYGIYYECYGGNDNDDLGDAYKGSTTDAITKIGSYLGIGADVWKDKSNKQQTTQPQNKTAQVTTQVAAQVPTQQQPQTSQQQKTVDMARRKERIVAYLNGLDFAELQNTLDYFNIEDVARITDQQVNAVADYLNAQKRQKQ